MLISCKPTVGRYTARSGTPIMDMESGDEDSEVPMEPMEMEGTGSGGAGPSATAVLPKKRRQTQPASENEEGEEDGQNQKKAKAPNKITVEDEAEVLEWFRGHPELYAKKSAKYLDTSQKARLISAKADEMGVNCEYISFFALFL